MNTTEQIHKKAVDELSKQFAAIVEQSNQALDVVLAATLTLQAAALELITENKKAQIDIANLLTKDLIDLLNN